MIEVIKKGQGTLNIFIIIIIIDCAPPPALQEGDLARCSGSYCSWPLLLYCTSHGWGKLSPHTLRHPIRSRGHLLQILDSVNQFSGWVHYYLGERSIGVTYWALAVKYATAGPLSLATCWIINTRGRNIRKKAHNLTESI